MTERINPIRHTSPQAIRLAKSLVRGARFGSLAVLHPETGAPFASRVAIATCVRGDPLLLVSTLSTHTQGLLANPQCSLLLGEPGKGDPLAHPRITLQCKASFLDRASQEGQTARARYLRHNPKGALYADFGDFSFVKLCITSASLNGGFGQAVHLTTQDFVCDENIVGALEGMEAAVLEHMNTDHRAAVNSIAQGNGGRGKSKWIMSGIDNEGVDLTSGDATLRVWFEAPMRNAENIRDALMDMTIKARQADK
jgi:hypothetical protein